MTNFLLKHFFQRLMNGMWIFIQSTISGYPTIDIRLATVLVKTAAYTVTQGDLDKPTILSNLGASGNVVITLPGFHASRGKVLRVAVNAAQTVQLLPRTGQAINYNGSAVVTKYCQIAGVVGNWIEIFSDGVQWIVTRQSGVVTKEA
jgi:hypothetical protein